MRRCCIAVVYVATAIAFLHSAAVVAAPETDPGVAGERSQASRHSAQFRMAGLWDAPNQACMTECQTLVNQGCFKDQIKKNPAADAASLNDRCEIKYSICLYDCMCENCKNAPKEKGN